METNRPSDWSFFWMYEVIQQNVLICLCCVYSEFLPLHIAKNNIIACLDLEISGWISVSLSCFCVFPVCFQGPLVGMNPVQIRATVELYPSSRLSPGGGTHHPEGPAGWFHSVHSRPSYRLMHYPNSLTRICWLDHFAKASAWMVPLCFTFTAKA